MWTYGLKFPKIYKYTYLLIIRGAICYITYVDTITFDFDSKSEIYTCIYNILIYFNQVRNAFMVLEYILLR